MIRPQTEDLHDYRGYAGKIISGVYRVGDTITVQPAGIQSKIKAIEIGGKEVHEAFAPQSVVLHLEDNIDISRGDVIVILLSRSMTAQELEVLLCWMDNKPLIPGNKYLLQINSRVVRSVVRHIEYKLDVNTLEKNEAPQQAVLNDVIKRRSKRFILFPTMPIPGIRGQWWRYFD